MLRWIGLVVGGFNVLSSIAFAGGVQVKESSGRMILEASNCEDLKSEVDAFSSWALLRNETTVPFSVECEDNSGPYQADLTSLIPDVDFIHNQKAVCDGPNCWNAALVDQGLLPYLRHTTSEEFDYYLRNFCTPRKGAPPQPGDMGSIRERTWFSSDHVHGFTYIGKMAYSKNGLSRVAKYLIQPLEDVMSVYGVDENETCRNANGAPSGCKLFVNYYQCDSQKKMPEVRPELKHFDYEISNAALEGLSRSDLNELKKALRTVQENIKDCQLNEREEVCFDSLKSQLEYLMYHVQSRRFQVKSDPPSDMDTP